MYEWACIPKVRANGMMSDVVKENAALPDHKHTARENKSAATADIAVNAAFSHPLGISLSTPINLLPLNGVIDMH